MTQIWKKSSHNDIAKNNNDKNKTTAARAATYE
jgi:hypothetical protein